MQASSVYRLHAQLTVCKHGHLFSLIGGVCEIIAQMQLLESCVALVQAPSQSSLPGSSKQVQLSTGQALVLQSLRCICARSVCESNQTINQPAIVCLNMNNGYNTCQLLFEHTQSVALPVKLLEVSHLLEVVLVSGTIACS